ncbi:hypothetical protein ES705_23874 [subsurface metagenome]
MKNFYSRFLGYIGLSILFVIGCATTVTNVVKVETNPPGAVIEFNGNMVGRAPCAFTATFQLPYAGCLYGNYNTFYYAAPGVYNYIRAIPVEEGQYTQTKILSNYNMVYQKNLTVYFDMNLKPIPEEHRIEWQNK